MRFAIAAAIVLLTASPALAGARRSLNHRDAPNLPWRDPSTWSDAQRDSFLAYCRKGQPEAFCRCWLDLSEARFPAQKDFDRALGDAERQGLAFDIDRCLVRHGRGR